VKDGRSVTDHFTSITNVQLP